jgi:predicted permease
MKNDLRFAVRMVTSHPWFSAAVIATLALGISVNATVFTLVNAVLFKPVPLPGGASLVTISNHELANPKESQRVAYPDFREYRASNRTFEGLEGVTARQGTISENGIPPERYSMALVSSGLFGMLRTPPAAGRDFADGDDDAGAEAVAIISHRVWQARYAGAADTVGMAIRINGAPTTIVGVMPEGFQFPMNEDLWMPLVPTEPLEDRANRRLMLFGRLAPGVSIARATEDLAVIGSRLANDFPDTNGGLGPSIRTFNETFNGGPIRAVFLLMLGAVGFVLLIACANVANLMLSRAIARRREMSVRAAIGASRWRLVRQILVESVLLSSVGGLIGLSLSTLGTRAFDHAVQDVGKPYWLQFDLDYVAFSYFAAISIGSGIVFGLVPALRAARVDLNTALQDGARTAGGRRGNRLTATLVVFQFALTVVLLGGAGMMVRSFLAAQALNPFVPAEHIFAARVQLPEGEGDRYEEPLTRLQFHEHLVQELVALPGVTHAATASNLPGLGSNQRPIEIEGRVTENPKQPPRASFVVQTPGYLQAIGLPILTGRGFEETDGDAGKEAAVITQEFAQRHWPENPAIGQRFRFVEGEAPGPWMEVVGVSADMVQDPQDPNAAPLVFITARQEPWGWTTLMVRTTSDPGAVTAQVRSVVQQLDPDLPLFEAATLPSALERQRWFVRVFGVLFSVFAFVGLLMASVGIYGVVAQGTARRTREIGIRMALGATATVVQKLVLTGGLRQLALGVVLGLGGAFAAARLMSNAGLLMRASPNDPVVFIAITVLLLVVGLVACWLPARRASRIAPTDALRTE